jgi:hypothetical protein
MHAGIQQGGRPDNWFTNPMSNFETSNPSLFERCFAAVFSGLAAGLTYAVWIYFRSGQWGPEQLADLMGIGKWGARLLRWHFSGHAVVGPPVGNAERIPHLAAHGHRASGLGGRRLLGFHAVSPV